MSGSEHDPPVPATARPGAGRVRVLLVCRHADPETVGHETVGQGLRAAFEGEADLDVVGGATTVAEATELLGHLRPDVLVADARLPDGDGIALAAAARAARRNLGIVVLTTSVGDRAVFAGLDAGASGFVGRDAPADEVVAAARRAAADPGGFTARDLAAVLHRREPAPAGPTLSPREREVLALLVDGLAIAQIARRVAISESTAKTHVAKIYDKLGAGNRAQAVMAAVRLGLVDA